jgi:cytochrome c
MKSMTMLGSALLAAAFVAVVPARAQEGDAAAGKKVFTKCMACHDAVTDKNKIGPSLLGVVGRTAGTLESFQAKYSQAMKDAGAGGLVWDEANIAEYLKDPKGKIPGNKMAFAGLKKDDEIANVIAYLKADPKP